MQWCPQCKIEHEDWAVKCSDCNVQLVDELPVEKKESKLQAQGFSDQINVNSEQASVERKSKILNFFKLLVPNVKIEKFFFGQIAAMIIAYIIYFILARFGIPVAQHISIALLFIMSLISLISVNNNVSVKEVLKSKKTPIILGTLILFVLPFISYMFYYALINLISYDSFFTAVLSILFFIFYNFLFILTYFTLWKICLKDKIFSKSNSNLSKRIFAFMIIGIIALLALKYIGQMIYFIHFMKNNFILTNFGLFSEVYPGTLAGFDNLVQYFVVFSTASFIFFRNPTESNEQSTKLQKFFVWQLCAIAAAVFCSVLINFSSGFSQLFENTSIISTAFTLLMISVTKGFIYFVPSIYVLYSLKNNIKLKDAIKYKPVKTSLIAIIVLILISILIPKILTGVAIAFGYILIYKFLSKEKLELFGKNSTKRNLMFFGIILLSSLIFGLPSLIFGADAIIAITVLSTTTLIYLSSQEEQNIPSEDPELTGTHD